jgi:hypothetical protein
MTFDRDKLNQLLRSRQTWTVVGTVAVGLLGLFGYVFPDRVTELWSMIADYMVAQP